MLQKTFEIIDENIQNCHCYAETGEEHFALWCIHPELNAVKAFELFQFDSKDTFAETLREIKNTSYLIKNNFLPAEIICENEEAAVLPIEYFKENDDAAFLNILFGDKKDYTLQTNLLGKKIIISRINNSDKKILQSYFPAASFVHKFYALLKMHTENIKDKTAYLVFYPKHFLFSLFDNKNLQLIRSIKYFTAEDVLYALLNICEQYGLNKEEVDFILSGMIEKQSSLYTTLYQYINNLQMDTIAPESLPDNAFKTFPPHFFSSFVNYRA